MRRVSSLLLIAGGIALLGVGVVLFALTDGPSFAIAGGHHDFGDISYQNKHEFRVRVSNTGSTTIRVLGDEGS